MLHDGLPPAPHDIWSAWSLEPGSLMLVVVTGVLYALGMWRPTVSGRAVSRAARWRIAAFWAGWLTLAVALLSPLHAMGGALLWAHMAQHELLMVVSAPLLVLGRPLVVSVRGLPRGLRREVGTWLRALHPATSWLSRIEVAWVLHAAAILVWHVPVLYDASVHSEPVHALQHGSFLGTALLFWFSVLTESRRRHYQGVAILSLFTTAVYTGGFGALLTVARWPWYPAYGAAAPLWGLTPLEDQQLAGLIMWVPAAASYLAATLWLVTSWLRASERLAVRREHLRRAAAVLPVLVLLLAACGERGALSESQATMLTGGDPARGRAAIRAYGCGTCHTLDGVPGANGLVGPPLDGIAARAYVAGVLTNTPRNLIRWIRFPREVDSLTAMPDLGVTAKDAQDIAAYLYTHP